MMDILLLTGSILIVIFFNLLLPYLFGSFPSGLVLTKIFTKTDIRNIGSGNIGATNVLRTGNKFLALATLVIDSLKAVIVILFLKYFYMHIGKIPNSIFLEAHEQTSLLVLYGFFVVVGHCFSIWLKFKGGKGVATAFGVLLAAVPWAGVIAAVTWGIVAGFFRYSSLAALCAMAMAPVAVVIFYGVAPAMITLLITLLVFWRHRENIQRLFAGKESKIGAKK